MDIQQKDKKSLAAYMHRFKREAKLCKFTSNAATMRIFVKGLKNAHTLAPHVYEKGPQTLADSISEVEKLQAVQQLTCTLLPLSAVNVMSNEEDLCFQCQEVGHIACHCWNVCCFECNEYGHITTDCPNKKRPSCMPACHKRQTLAQGIMSDQLLDTTTGTGIDIAGQDHNHSLTNIEVRAIITHTEVIPDHITDTITGALHETVTPALIFMAMTHRTRDHPDEKFLNSFQRSQYIQTMYLIQTK